MNLEEKANRHSVKVMSKGFEQRMPKTDFKAGYRECKTDLIEFLKVNHRASIKDILKHLKQLV